MATKNAALRNLLANAFGGGFDAGTLVIKEGATTIATFTLPADAFAAASDGAVALNGVPLSATADNASSGASATLTADLIGPSSTNQLTGLTVSTSGAQVTIDNKAVAAGQTLNLTAFTWTESASA